MSINPQPDLPLKPAHYAALETEFREQGFLLLKRVIDAQALTALSARIVTEFEAAREADERKSLESARLGTCRFDADPARSCCIESNASVRPLSRTSDASLPQLSQP
jgi:hypothetical protein